MCKCTTCQQSKPHRCNRFFFCGVMTPMWNTRVLGVRIKQVRCTCFTTQMSPKAVWSRRLRNMQVSRCSWSVNCCVQACKQTQRDTQGKKRVNCAHVGRRGFTRQPESPNMHMSGSWPSKTPPKFNVKTPKREKKERKLWR